MPPPPPFLPVCIGCGALGFGMHGSKYPCCHITALMQATRVSDFPVTAPPVMEETTAPSSRHCRTAKAWEGFRL